ncbi:MAG: aminopeptidase [Cyclobacteriaceae bacterium]
MVAAVKRKKNKGWFKKVVLIFIGLLLALFLWQHELILYGIRQAKGQINILANAQPISIYLNDPGYPDSLKHKLRLIQEAKSFAVDSLGMKPTDNYTKMYDQQGMPVLWVVTASEPYRMKQKEWNFPLLGSFSYKGFFELDLAQTEEEHLQALGYDTGIRTVGGWSTLGWFDDPILSNMLLRDDGMLADLIIHELTHTTLYIKDSVQFNENLATFIGNEGARKFLAVKYGPKSTELQHYQDQLQDRQIFAEHVLEYYFKLDSLYQTFTAETTDAEKKARKNDMIREFVATIDNLKFTNKENYEGLFSQGLPNNTFFQSYLRYRGNLDALEQQYQQQFDSNLQSMLDYYRSRYTSL